MEKSILSADSKTLETLGINLKNAKLSELSDVQKIDNPEIKLGDKTYDHPVRLGQILDDLTTRNHQNKEEIIEFAQAALYVHRFTLKKAEKENIALTEKEVEILKFLHKSKPQIISKEELLEAVWNYAENVETHTLETHIYRLRQKIEDDSANPGILITKSGGYTVS